MNQALVNWLQFAWSSLHDFFYAGSCYVIWRFTHHRKSKREHLSLEERVAEIERLAQRDIPNALVALWRSHDHNVRAVAENDRQITHAFERVKGDYNALRAWVVRRHRAEVRWARSVTRVIAVNKLAVVRATPVGLRQRRPTVGVG